METMYNQASLDYKELYYATRISKKISATGHVTTSGTS